MLEITPDNIAALADDDLRTLVGLLCEAHLRSLGLSSAAITFGGHQDAPDSGLDVRVALPLTTIIHGFVPRPVTGFQVKKPDMPRSTILKEMRPSGTIRAAIQELAEQSGAYIIVSSSGSTSDLALRDRRKAMTEAVRDVANANSLTLDFYDRTRLATWVRDHPGLIPWVRERVGRPIAGWHSYGPWAYPREGPGGEYLLDDKARILTGRREDGYGLPVLEGLKRIRSILRAPGSVVRLVGLSGVGKTRLLQAFFDDRIGEQALDPALAFYTNMGDDPDPQPTGLASYLVASRTRAILVVDNCHPELHRRLSEVCRSADSTVSVITVEYDIREDEPEGTDVFRLEPSSVDLIEKLVKHRFEEVSSVDARTVAEFSGGNARIAIALAATIGKKETIADLNNEELFRRLFEQRHGHDPALLLTAQACSLVYSFQGEDLSSDEAELPRLGALIGKDAGEVYRDVAILRSRDLVQQRSVWRAVLPHAIANRLAAMTLESIPQETIEAQLVYGAPARLMKSFSRRLGYLHTSKSAVRIVEQWLSADGLLGDVAQLNDLGKAMLENVAPAAMEAILGALERALAGPNREQLISRCRDFVRLIRSIAYDAKLFDRSAPLLVAFVLGEEAEERRNDTVELFASLFFLHLSGTHASIEQRLRVIKPLLQSGDPKRQGVGLKALSAALEAWHFMSGYGFEFGAHSRDHGYWPRTYAEVKHWFSSGLKLVEEVASSGGPAASEVRGILAEKFRGLWSRAGAHDDLERVSREISGKLFWPEGWIAVRETLAYDSKDIAPDIRARLASLERRLRPKDLVQKVHSIVLSTRSGRLDLADFEDAGDPVTAYERMEKIAEALGNETAQDEAVFDQLLPALFGDGGRMWPFGRGLAEGAKNPQAIWRKLVAALAAKPEGKRSVQLIRGFLRALMQVNPGLANAILDEAVEDTVLAHWFPALQSAALVDERGLARVKRSLAGNGSPIRMFSNLAGWPLKSLPGAELKGLILAIATKPDGFDVALELLSRRFHLDTHEKRDHEHELIQAGRELLHQVVFRRNQRQDDYKLGEIAERCLKGVEGITIAREMGRKLRHAMAKFETSAYDNLHLVQALLKVQPSAVLDAFLGGADRERKQGIRALQEMSEHQKNPLDVISESALFGWCDQDPTTHYPTMAAVVSFFQRSKENSPLQWTDVALHLLERAPDRVAVLKEVVRRFSPMSWSGSRAAIVEARAKLLDELNAFSDAAVVEYITQEKIRLAREIEQEREQENREDRARGERFE